MILKYGSYAHDSGEVQFSLDRREVKNQLNLRTHYVERWVITGVKIGTSQSDLTSKLQALEAAYADNDKDLVFYLADGSTETAHSLQTANTLNGTRVVGGVSYTPGMPGVWGARTEYVFMRSYRIVVEAEIPALEGGDIISWHETVRTIATGGPKYVYQQALTGPVQRQQVAEFTPVRVMQSGQAVGFYTYPTPSVLFPQYLQPTPYLYENTTPENWGKNDNTHFKTRWSFFFEGDSGLIATPPSLSIP